MEEDHASAMMQVILARHGDERQEEVSLQDVQLRSDDEEGLTSEESSEESGSSSDEDDDDESGSSGESSSEDDEADADDDDEESKTLLPHGDPGEPIGAGWARYTDPSTGYEYYFNHVSGASQWHRPQISRSTIAVQPLPAAHSQQSAVTPKRRHGRHANPSADLEMNSTSIRKGPESTDDDDDDDDDDDPEYIHGEDDVVRAVNFYVWSSIFHIVCIEGPAVAFEAFFRGLYLLFTGAILTVAQQPYALGRGRLRMGLQMVLALPTLLVPGALLLAYRDLLRAWRDGRLARSAQVDDWKLGSVPTFAGPLSAETFHVVMYGQGSHARNVAGRRK